MHSSLRKSILPVAVAVLGLRATATYAWNFVGHEVVARIAWDNLTPVARDQIKQIIRQHPALQPDLIKDMPADFGDRDLYAFMVSATWPDVVRDKTNPWHNQHNHPTWHYIDMPYVVPGTDESRLKNATRGNVVWQPGTEPANVVQALQKCEADLRDPKTSLADKAVALSWYLHLGGDLHQPLHANTLFSNTYPAGDKGGNGSFVRASVLTTQPSIIPLGNYLGPRGGDLMQSGKPSAAPASVPTTMPAPAPINLHAYWDNVFGRLAPPAAIDALQREITAEHPPADLRKQTGDVQYADWVEESFALAIHAARNDGALQTATQDEANADPSTVPLVPPGYLERAQAVARLRTATAGYRLAKLLNDIFDTH